MLMIEINPNWNYKQTLANLRALRLSYDNTLRSFSYFNLHDKVLFTYQFKQSIYSLPFETWKKDRIWEYLNHDIAFAILQNFK